VLTKKNESVRYLYAKLGTAANTLNRNRYVKQTWSCRPYDTRPGNELHDVLCNTRVSSGQAKRESFPMFPDWSAL